MYEPGHKKELNMVIRKKGSVFFIDGKEFKIGGGVFANALFDWFIRFNSSIGFLCSMEFSLDELCPYSEFMLHDLLAILFLV